MRAALLLLTAALALALAAPTFVSLDSIAAVIRDESRLHARLLGEDVNGDALARARSWLGSNGPLEHQMAHRAAVNDPLSARLAQAGTNILETAYFQRARALTRLVVYRAAALVEWLILGFPLVMAAIVDGAMMRTVRTRSFAHLSPIHFGIGVHGTLAVLGLALVLLFVPSTIHPLAWAGLVALFAVTVRAVVANFHRLR